MPRIERLAIREIRMPLRQPFRISSGVVTERKLILLEVTDSDGLSAWSECVALDRPNYSPETVDTAWIAITKWLAERLLGFDCGNLRDAFAVLDVGIRGHLMAKAAAEMVVWDLAAQSRGISLADILGGTRNRVATGISLGIQPSPTSLVRQAFLARELGYRRIKLKIEPGADLEYVAAVREALGGQMPLSVDANSAYRIEDAERLRELDKFDLVMIEQPLAPDDLCRHAALQRRLRTPVCLDESITGFDRVEDMIELGSGRIVNIKPGRVGGFGPSLLIHNLCAANGIPVWCGGMLETGIGRAYNVALASLPNFTLPGDLSPSTRYWEKDIVMPEWVMDDDGYVRVPRELPGLGVSVDKDRVENLTLRCEVLRRHSRSNRSPRADAGVGP